MEAKKKFAVILSGCGVYDGAEIHEATLTLLAIHKLGGTFQVFAPDVPQHHVINHLTGEVMAETRNVLVESARIARGNARPLSDYRTKDFDAIILPGGFGAAKNLSDFAFKGARLTVHEELKKVLKETHQAGKPIGALCIAPVILAKIFERAKVTIGQDHSTAAAIVNMGAEHVSTGHREVVIDRVHKLVTSPCYMLDANLADIAEGAENTVRALLEMM